MENSIEGLIKQANAHIEKLEQNYPVSSPGRGKQLPEMKATRKRNVGKLVIGRTKALERAMQSLVMSPKDRSEIAFAIAEISPEMEFLLTLIRRAKRKGRITYRNLEDVNGMIAWHWPLHLRDLTNALRRVFKAVERQRSE